MRIYSIDCFTISFTFDPSTDLLMPSLASQAKGSDAKGANSKNDGNSHFDLDELKEQIRNLKSAKEAMEKECSTLILKNSVLEAANSELIVQRSRWIPSKFTPQSI